MIDPVWLGLLVVTLFACVAHLAIWSRRDTFGRPAAVALFVVGLVAVPVAFADSLSYPKPFAAAWEIDPTKEYIVLGAKMQQDVAIWIYLDVPGGEPRSYRLPWSNETASALQQAMDEAPEGMNGMALFRYDPDGQKAETVFHPFPIQPDPPAKAPPERGLTYQQD
jgi:hypothetical protein